MTMSFDFGENDEARAEMGDVICATSGKSQDGEATECVAFVFGGKKVKSLV